MQWALVATEEQPFTYYVMPTYDDNYMMVSDGYYTTITAPVGMILNLIVYDGGAEYTPPAGMKLVQVPDDAKIADTGY